MLFRKLLGIKERFLPGKFNLNKLFSIIAFIWSPRLETSWDQVFQRPGPCVCEGGSRVSQRGSCLKPRSLRYPIHKGGMITNTLQGLLWEINEQPHIKFLAQFLGTKRFSINVSLFLLLLSFKTFESCIFFLATNLFKGSKWMKSSLFLKKEIFFFYNVLWHIKYLYQKPKNDGEKKQKQGEYCMSLTPWKLKSHSSKVSQGEGRKKMGKTKIWDMCYVVDT